MPQGRNEIIIGIFIIILATPTIPPHNTYARNISINT